MLTLSRRLYGCTPLATGPGRRASRPAPAIAVARAPGLGQWGRWGTQEGERAESAGNTRLVLGEMFYSQFILAKRGPLGTIWIAAHLDRKLRKQQITETDVAMAVCECPP